jgi:NADH-quinone oxidoreductase subunit M
MRVPILSLILHAPMLAMFMLLLIPREATESLRRAALAFSILPFLLSLWLLAAFDPTRGDLQFAEHVVWNDHMGISYALGVDGFSLWLILLITFMTPLLILAAWKSIDHGVKEFLILNLFLESAMIGALVSADLFLFFVYWELMLAPMFFIVGVWGGERRRYATIKFVLYTIAGSAFFLVGMLYVVFKHAGDGPLTFDILQLYNTPLTLSEQRWLFASFAVAFAIKVPMLPFHTWLPDAHTEAPTAGSMVLAAVLLKMGVYGFLRFAIPMFPDAAVEAFPIIMGIAVLGIFYGAFVAFPQPDMKRMIAYSSVSHMGFVMLGIYAFNLVGVTGGVLQMINHGLSTGALFLMVGFIYERRHTRMIEQYGGLWAVIPVFSVFFLIVTLSSIALPGTNSFVGEFLILLGAFRTHPWAAALATGGVILSAVYMLTMYKHVVFGPIRHKANELLEDLTPRELAVLLPMVAMIFVIGLYPRPFLERIEPTVTTLLARMEAAGARIAVAEPGRGGLELTQRRHDRDE